VTNPIQPLPPTAVHANADLYLGALHAHRERPTLLYHRGEFYRHKLTHWELTDREALQSWVYRLFKDTWYTDSQGNVQPFNINMVKTKAIVDALQNELHVDRGIDVPAWFDKESPNHVTHPPGLPAREMIATSNCLLHSRTRQVYAHTPRFFNQVAVHYPFDATATTPVGWLDFLNDLWPDDAESIDTLQEIFGYLLTARTDLQKFFMIIGPPRSGKGTIIRVLTALLGGDGNVASVSLADLNQRFGLEEIESKNLAVMQDARFRSRDDGVAVERILSITGEDPVSIEKKGKGIFSARLMARFLLVSNELPKMSDESGALRSRVVMLKLTKTVEEARRDVQLTERLLVELPGILNWALDGLDRLNRRGRLEQPKSAAEHLELLANLSSPKQAFVEQYCRVHPDGAVKKQLLFDVWKYWCTKTNTMPGNEVHFARDLYAAVSNVKSSRRTEADGKKVQYYAGIGLNPEGTEIAAAISYAQQMTQQFMPRDGDDSGQG
jgi:putative DNA primase/helicase